MAVVSSVEMWEGTSLSGAFGESFRFVRRWKIRVDNPLTSKVLMARSMREADGITPVGYGSPHPDFADHKAVDFSVDCDDKSGLWWIGTVNYRIPDRARIIDPVTGIPEDAWKLNSRDVKWPFVVDIDGTKVCNSAGDPIEGLSTSGRDFGWNLQKCFEDYSAFLTFLHAVSDCVNDGTWDGEPARRWLCFFRGAEKRVTSAAGDAGGETTEYVEAHFDIVHNWAGWDQKPWDTGFNEKVDSAGNPSTSGTYRRAILGVDGRPTRQPVALSGGVAVPAGTLPTALTFREFGAVNFSAQFGSPTL